MLKDLPCDTQIQADGMLLLTDKKDCDNAYERDDLKITLKLFLETFAFHYISDATG